MQNDWNSKRYQLIESLGTGRMGEVYLTYDRLTRNRIALKKVKLLPAQQAAKPDPTPPKGSPHHLALAQEFEILATLRHPHIISVLDYGFGPEMTPYYTMTYLPEANTLLQAGAGCTLNEKLSLFQQLTEAIAYLHRRGVYHRDLKPENILVTDQQLRVLDFGLAVIIDANEAANLSPKGTAPYWAPEIWMGQAITNRTDFFALGILFFELLTDQHPFGPRDSFMMDRILDAPPQWDLLNHTPSDDRLRPILEKLLQKAADDRYRSAEEVLADLNRHGIAPSGREEIEIRESFLQAAKFVGRETEITQLTDALSQAQAGAGSIWLIGGESGVGKSRLIDEIRTQALVSGWQVIQGQGMETGGAPYQPWAEIVPHLALDEELSALEASILSTIAPGLDRLLDRPIEPPPPITDQSSQRRLMRTLVSLILRAQQPLLLILEDLQWSTESLQPLRYLASGIGQRQIMIIVSYRDEEQPDLAEQLPSAQMLTLPRLADRDIEMLSTAILGDRVANQPALIARLQQETEGNTFFLIEIIRALAEEAGHLTTIDADSLPEQIFTGGINQIIQKRLSRIPAGAQRLLQRAAVAGRFLDLTLLDSLAQEEDLERWLELCQASAILTVDANRWLFAHDKIRETILTELSSEMVPELNREVAEALEVNYPDDQEKLAALAQHWGAANRTDKEKIYAGRAGKQALNTFSHAEAVRLLKRALILTSPVEPAERFKLLIDLERAYYFMGKRDAQAQLYQELLRLGEALGPRKYATALLRQGTYALAIGNTAKLLELGKEMETLGQAHQDRSILVEAYHLLAGAYMELGQLDDMERVCQAGIKLFEESGPPLKSGVHIGYFWAKLAIWADYRQDYVTASEYNRKLLEFSNKKGDKYGAAVATGNLGMTAYLQGDYATAREMTVQSQASFHEVGETFGAAASIINIAFIDLQLDRERAATTFHQALVASQQIGAVTFVIETLVGAAEVYLNAGQAERATQLAGFCRAHPQYNEDVALRLDPFEPKLAQVLSPEEIEKNSKLGEALELDDLLNDYYETFPLT